MLNFAGAHWLLLNEVHITIGAISVVLASVLFYLFLRVYRTQRSLYLLAVPTGFLFLAISYLFLFLHLLYPYVMTLSPSLMWVRVVTQTWGFTLIAFSYFLSNKTPKNTKHTIVDISGWSIAAVICIFGLLVLLSPTGLPGIYSDNIIFTVANLFLVSYILFFITRKFENTSGSVSGLISAPLAFGLLWLGQFCFLIWDIDGGGEACLISSQVARVISLLLFIRIYYLASKESVMIDG